MLKYHPVFYDYNIFYYFSESISHHFVKCFLLSVSSLFFLFICFDFHLLYKKLFIFKNKVLESRLKTFLHKSRSCQQVGLTVRLLERTLQMSASERLFSWACQFPERIFPTSCSRGTNMDADFHFIFLLAMWSYSCPKLCKSPLLFLSFIRVEVSQLPRFMRWRRKT